MAVLRAERLPSLDHALQGGWAEGGLDGPVNHLQEQEVHLAVHLTRRRLVLAPQSALQALDVLFSHFLLQVPLAPHQPQGQALESLLYSRGALLDVLETTPVAQVENEEHGVGVSSVMLE